jgi:hypothetical protein
VNGKQKLIDCQINKKFITASKYLRNETFVFRWLNACRFQNQTEQKENGYCKKIRQDNPFGCESKHYVIILV